MAFAPEYVRLVLDENFEDAKRLFLEPLLAIHRAHLTMLAATSIVTPAVARQLRAALDRLGTEAIGATRFDGSCEDLFFHLERLIIADVGPDVAGRLHTARSRNDIDMTMYRMRVRGDVLDLAEACVALRESLLDLADRHLHTIIVAHTHTQRAQPTTVAHYALAVVEQLERDLVRLQGAYARTNCCPLGACAITGTGFPIDRGLTASLLGFDQPTGNTYGSIAAVDYLLEGVSAAAVLLVGLGRVVQDLLFWASSEVGDLRVGDGFVQASSIMPQKRNPVGFEHARALASKGLGQAQAVVLAVHNTPFGDVVDTEDDLQPLVAAVFRDAVRATLLTAAALRSVTLDEAALEAKARDGWATLTELADTLVREHGLSFRAAHEIAKTFMGERQRRPGAPPAGLLREAARAVAALEVDYSDARLEQVLDPRHFVAVRTTQGGPAPGEAARAAAVSREALERDRLWVSQRRRALDAATAMLRRRMTEL